MDERLDELQARIGHRFRQADLLARALTHRSFGADHNERLEFLGDAVLSLAVSSLLFERFAGSDEGGRRAAAMYTLIETAKLNDTDPQAWLAEVLARLPDHPARRIGDLLPWNWRPPPRVAQAA